jgi:hypothetical protein
MATLKGYRGYSLPIAHGPDIERSG